MRAIGRLCLGTIVFIVILLFAATHPSAAGLMLTFPALNGLGLLYTEQSSIPGMAKSMLWLPVLNGILCAVYIVMFLVSANSSNANPLAVGLFLLIAGLWIGSWLGKWLKNGVAEDRQHTYAARTLFAGALFVIAWIWIEGSYGPTAVGTRDGFLHLVPTVLVKSWWKIGLFVVAFSIFLFVGNRKDTPDWIRGVLAGLPLVPFFGLLSVAFSFDEALQDQIQTLRGMGLGLCLGPAIAVCFIILVSRMLAQRHQSPNGKIDGLARFGIVASGWLVCFAVITALSVAIDWLG
jgi:uncharacterized membrane protein